jgi:hypothetical protein
MTTRSFSDRSTTPSQDSALFINASSRSKASRDSACTDAFPRVGYHLPVALHPETERTLALLFPDYRDTYSNDLHWNLSSDVCPSVTKWVKWIRRDLNADSPNSEEGKYAIELRLNWSAPKFLFWGVSPVLLSLAFGLAYAFKPLPAGGDHIAVLQTSWTIASYIVTAAACEIPYSLRCLAFNLTFSILTRPKCYWL